MSTAFRPRTPVRRAPRSWRRTLRAPASVFFGLYVAMAGVVAGGVTGRLHRMPLVPAHAAVPVTKHAKYLVLMVLDGARPDYFGLTDLPHVDALRAEGVQFTNAFDGILESETPAGHTTLSTGSSPARDGILGFDWAQNDDDFSLFSPDVIRQGALEHIMEQAHVPTIASLFKRRYPHAKVVALSGHKYYAADPLGGPDADAIMYYHGDDHGKYVPVAIPGHTPPPGVLDVPGVIGPNTHLADGLEDRLATMLALQSFKVMHQQITLINYPEFDWPVGHVDGGIKARGRVVKLMKSFDRDLGSIERAYKRAGVLNQTLFVITADHGMAPISRFVSHDIFNNAVTAAGTTAPDIAYNTGAYIWLADTRKAGAVARNIMRANDPGIQSVYYLDTSHGAPRYTSAGGFYLSKGMDAANSFLLRTLLNGRQPQVVALCKAGNTTSNPSTHWKADHGGASWQSQHIPLILAGPNIRQQMTVEEPAQLEDIAPTALAALGVPSTGMEGTAISEVLARPSKAQQAARRAEIGSLSPLVDALVAQDTIETGS